MLIDTFPSFLRYWETARHRSINDQIRLWADSYLSEWPDLFSVQVEDYRSQGIDWHDIARQRIFPHLPERLDGMRTAHGLLLPLCESVSARTRELLNFDLPVTFVIHVGIGCGAGWAVKFRGLPSVLLGLENIVEEDWVDARTLESLLGHEVSHLAYHHWREQAGQPDDETPWGQLVDEGFATHCESVLLAQGAFHEERGDEGWLDWCQQHTAWLGCEFLRCVETGEPVTKFFGSWFDIQGHSQTGYFLGERLVAAFVAKGLSLREIARMNPAEMALAGLKEIISSGNSQAAM